MNRDESGRLWVVAVAEHKREASANFNLLRLGYDTFWVHYSAIARHARTSVQVLRSYYPGYLFVAVDEPYHVAPIARVRDVAGVLWDVDDEHYLPTKWLAEMRLECLNASGLHEPPADGPPERGRFHSGDRVKCHGTVWDQFVSTVLRDTGKLVEVDHGEVFGKRIIGRYDPIQVERA